VIDLVENWNNKPCARAVSDAEDLYNEWGVTVSRQIKRKRSFPGEDACDSGLSTQEEMCLFSKEILIKLEFEISDHFSQLCGLDCQFSFLCNAKSLVNQIEPSKL
jgi:hypothetical protein